MGIEDALYIKMLVKIVVGSIMQQMGRTNKKLHLESIIGKLILPQLLV